MLVTTVGKLKEKFPDAEFKVFSIYPGKDRTLITDPKIQILSSKPFSLLLVYLPFSMIYWFFRKLGIRFWVPASVRRLLECAVLYDIGGITFAERGVVLFYNILTLWPAMLLGTPVVKLSQAIGPFKSPINRFFARKFLSRCLKVYPRGEISAKCIANLRLQMKAAAVSTDIAFLYNPNYSLSSENLEKVELLKEKLMAWNSSGRKLIVFSPSTVLLKKMGSPKYELLMKNLIEIIDHPEYQYIFIPNSNRAGSGSYQNNDIQVNNKIRMKLEQGFKTELLSKIEWIDWDINTAGIQQIINCANLVVTSRFHSMISSLSLGVPVYVIGWGHKYLEILKMFAFEEWMSDYHQIDVNKISEKITQLIVNEDDMRRRIIERIKVVRKSSEIQFDQIDLKFP
jgi:colanic acid/amylovoran biosynthesis protein